MLDHHDALGVHTPNVSGSPIVEVPLDDADDLHVVGRLLWDAGIYVTLAAYPLVPRASVGFRVQLTAANSDQEVDELLTAITTLAERSLLQTSRDRGASALSGSPTLPRRVQDRGTPRSCLELASASPQLVAGAEFDISRVLLDPTWNVFELAVRR